MTAETRAAVRPPWWRNLRVLRAVAQVAAVLGALAVFVFLLLTVRTNLEAKGISTSFDFLTQPAAFTIAGSDLSRNEPIWKFIIFGGAKNTLLSVALGLPLTTLLGVIVGVARLSRNFLVRQAATIYVETLRNIPPLLVILFTFLALLLPLPTIQEAATPFDLFVISNREIGLPSLTNQENAGIFWILVAAALVAAVVVWIWRTGIFNRTGTPHHRVLWSLGTFALIVAAAYILLGGPIALSRPVVEPEGRLITGGFKMLASYVTVTLALTVYTASHVAEIVRGSILAVPKGQTEASFAVGLTNFQRYRFVILPQAARIAIPPMINQYLNFTKNTSLALAVGYAEVTFVIVTVIGNANPAPQSIAILMVVYLIFSLVISVISNAVNRRLQLASKR
jgi:general L-amino acid transport system permease protein